MPTLDRPTRSRPRSRAPRPARPDPLAAGYRRAHRQAIGADWFSIDMKRATVEIDYEVLRIKGAGLQRLHRTKSDG